MLCRDPLDFPDNAVSERRGKREVNETESITPLPREGRAGAGAGLRRAAGASLRGLALIEAFRVAVRVAWRVAHAGTTARAGTIWGAGVLALTGAPELSEE
ncbi:hypothetical protein [Micromonospora tarensis]|uniref:Uncharacterized protein n=1 Tax=Micromonospora tarensis TaxID=2806100 RepID=A0ABS1YLR7_9ACTN|nr:hypothetical protein [Micromonospora tarensis]MBM0278378.1 hypothetical protein [Micromonospora tarensis]